MRILLCLAAATLLVAGCTRPAPRQPFSQAVLDRALADPGRKADSAADSRRHPGELIALAGVAPGDKVLDLIPGTGYWTRIFSKIVGPTGKVYSVWPQAYARYAMGNVQDLKKVAAGQEYANVAVEVQPSAVLSAPEPLDVVWTSQNYHDYPDEYMGKDADPAALDAAVFNLLKHGGVYMVIDHMAKPGRGLADTEKLHRIDPAIVRQQVEAAGFRFAGESKVLNNPADPLDIPVFDRSIRGHTSQFAYKFVKP